MSAVTILSGGRVLDPTTGRDEVADVVVRDGVVVAIGAGAGVLVAGIGLAACTAPASSPAAPSMTAAPSMAEPSMAEAVPIRPPRRRCSSVST